MFVTSWTLVFREFSIRNNNVFLTFLTWLMYSKAQLRICMVKGYSLKGVLHQLYMLSHSSVHFAPRKCQKHSSREDSSAVCIKSCFNFAVWTGVWVLRWQSWNIFCVVRWGWHFQDQPKKFMTLVYYLQYLPLISCLSVLLNWKHRVFIDSQLSDLVINLCPLEVTASQLWEPDLHDSQNCSAAIDLLQWLDKPE